MSRKHQNKHDRRSKSVIEIADKAAREQGPDKKTWSLHDLRRVFPITESQKELYTSYINGYNVCAAGSAGTGKSYLALYLAFDDILNADTQCDHVIIVRSAVPTRNIGFKPGTTEEKLAEYETPYIDICTDLFRRKSTYGDMKKANLLTFVDTSCIRGQTWNDAVVIIEEVENMNFHEINSVMTRIGKNSKVIITGDIKQTDLLSSNKDTSGMVEALRVLERIPSFKTVQFTRNDIVRSGFVRDWIIAVEDNDGRQ